MQGLLIWTSGARRHFVQPCSADTMSSGYVRHPSRSETKGRVPEAGAQAVWSASSQQPVYGVGRLRNNCLDARWQSSGLQLPLISIQFHCKVTIQGIYICADYMRGESCNPNRRFGSVHRHSQPQATAIRRDVAPEPTPPVHFCCPASQSPASPPPSPQGQENSEVTCADDTTPKAAGRADTDHGCFEVLTSRPPVGLQPSDITGAVTPLCSLIQQHQAAFVAHTSEARKLVDECAAANVSTLSLLQSTVQGLQEQQTAQMATGLNIMGLTSPTAGAVGVSSSSGGVGQCHHISAIFISSPSADPGLG
ncbi:uncharacterized protein LOC144102620 isoform X1 [Amblyomma americanum]